MTDIDVDRRCFYAAAFAYNMYPLSNGVLPEHIMAIISWFMSSGEVHMTDDLNAKIGMSYKILLDESSKIN